MEIHCSRLRHGTYWIIMHSNDYSCVFRGNVTATSHETAIIRALTHIIDNPRKRVVEAENLTTTPTKEPPNEN